MTAPPFRPYGSFQNPPTHSRLAEQCGEILTGNNSNRQLFTLIHFSIVVEGRPEEGASLHKVDHCRPPTTNTTPTDQVNIVNVSSLLSSNLHFHVYSFLSLRFIERMKEAVNQSVQVRSTPRFTSVQTSVPLFRSVVCCRVLFNYVVPSQHPHPSTPTLDRFSKFQRQHQTTHHPRRKNEHKWNS